MGKRETGWRKGGGGGWAYIRCEWKLTLHDHSTTEENVALVQGALKEIGEEGVMEVDACEDFL